MLSLQRCSFAARDRPRLPAPLHKGQVACIASIRHISDWQSVRRHRAWHIQQRHNQKASQGESVIPSINAHRERPVCRLQRTLCRVGLESHLAYSRAWTLLGFAGALRLNECRRKKALYGHSHTRLIFLITDDDLSEIWYQKLACEPTRSEYLKPAAVPPNASLFPFKL